LLFIYHWSNKTIQSRIAEESSLSKNTVSNWCYFMRETCQIIFLFANIKLGWVDEDKVGKIVEIDESLFLKENRIGED
jgi:hypothetical protein